MMDRYGIAKTTFFLWYISLMVDTATIVNNGSFNYAGSVKIRVMHVLQQYDSSALWTVMLLECWLLSHQIYIHIFGFL